MMRYGAIVLALSALLAGNAQAAHYSDTYVIPIVGHVEGANGTMWMSDVAIRNFSNETLNVELILVESGVNTFDNIFPLVTDDLDGSVAVTANSTVLLRDLLEGYEDVNVTGALILGGDRPFAVTSRAYTSDSPLGQTVEPQRDFLDTSLGTLDNTAFAYIPGVMQNAMTRTNVGFVAGSGGSGTAMTVEITVRNGAGGTVGTRRVTIPGGTFAHMQFPISSFVTTSFDVGSVDFRVVEGEGVVIPYASMVDNMTGEAAFVTGVFPDSVRMTSFAAKSGAGLIRELIERVTR
jgi:hypothetical protein